MTDKPHRLLFADLSAPGETGDRRDAGAVECLPLLGEAEFFEQTTEVATNLLIPGKGFFFLGTPELRNQGDESGVQGRDQEAVSLGDKGDGSRLFIDSGKGHRGLAQPTSLMECNFEGDAHPMVQIGEGKADELDVLGGEFGAFLHAGHLDPESGSDILLNMTPFQGLEEDCAEDSEVKKCGGGGTFSEAREPDLASQVVFHAKIAGNLGGDSDALFFKEFFKDRPDLNVFFERFPFFCGVEPDRNPFTQQLSRVLWCLSLFEGFFDFQRGRITRLADACDLQKSGLSSDDSGFVFPLDPPVRGVLSLVNGSHELYVTHVPSESKN